MKAVDFTFYQQTISTFGFKSSPNCDNPFDCYSGSTSHTHSTGNFTAVLTELYFKLYFTSRTLTDSG